VHTPVDPRWRRPSPVNLEAIASSSTRRLGTGRSLNPAVVQVMKEKGIDISMKRTKADHQMGLHADVIVTRLWTRVRVPGKRYLDWDLRSGR